MYDEFMNAWADDLITLRDARHVLLSVTEPGNPTKVANAVFCRHLIIAVVGNIELLLTRWHTRDRSDVLDAYFATSGSNHLRIESLIQAFQDSDFEIDTDIFEDYLALKYLRNAIEHWRWKETEKEWIVARGFPSDIFNFTLEDFDRISRTYNALAIHIGQTKFHGKDRDRFAQLAKNFAE